MELLFLGSGTSTGVPSLCCHCEVCKSEDPRNKRLRSSILVRNGDYHLLVDTSTDLRQQCLAHQIDRIDAVLYTHHHADHVHGIDELRSFNFFNKMVTPCYGNQKTIDEIQSKFNYIFTPPDQVGGGLPQLQMHLLNGNSLQLGGIEVTPVDVWHGKMIITAYRMNNMAYVTDCSGLTDDAREKLQGLDLLVINALGFDPHATHFCLPQALEAIEELKPRTALLTHINHKFDHEEVSKTLPENVGLAYDGLTIEL
ncbi:MAG: MBL fold metallo-hydrolase [Candidatus Nitrohelix vancouverensis]|uniref:MBL fold metallo-hydrolase n=1 Tax=Candidatus Nitrohelix vancouverensis TaxID=2705534 RepID=A0A7T0G4I4_9BACT|nr:MAG: MBL fold metallo-hydrolase [Candidatus Nitrohelix vancouverensis]